MNNLTYQIHLFYNPMRVSGQTLSNIGGVTQSIPTYTDAYYTAYMPTLSLSATGSDYRGALNNLLIVATASTTIDSGILPYKPTW